MSSLVCALAFYGLGACATVPALRHAPCPAPPDLFHSVPLEVACSSTDEFVFGAPPAGLTAELDYRFGSRTSLRMAGRTIGFIDNTIRECDEEYHASDPWAETPEGRESKADPDHVHKLSVHKEIHDYVVDRGYIISHPGTLSPAEIRLREPQEPFCSIALQIFDIASTEEEQAMVQYFSTATYRHASISTEGLLVEAQLAAAEREWKAHRDNYCAVERFADSWFQIAFTHGYTIVSLQDMSHEPGFQRALDLWDAFLETHPTDAQAINWRANMLRHMRRTEEARRSWQLACDLGDADSCASLKRLNK